MGAQNPPVICACPGLCTGGSATDTSASVSSTAWNVTTFAGNGSGWHIDGPPGVGTLCQPVGLAVYGNGTLLVGDTCSNYPAIRAVSPDGYISTLVGNGTTSLATATSCPSADGVGAGSGSAILWGPRVLLLDASDMGGTGSLIFADVPCNMVRIMSPALVVSTIAGVGSNVVGSNPTLPLAARSIGFGFSLISNTGLALLGRADTGTLFVSDAGHHRVYRINLATGLVSPCVGATGGLSAPLVDAGVSGTATLNYPTGLALDPWNNLIVADTYDARLKNVTFPGPPTCSAKTFAGSPGATVLQGSVDGVGTNTRVYYPQYLHRDSSNSVWMGEVNSPRVRRLSFPSLRLTTIAGSGTNGFADGIGPMAQFSSNLGAIVTNFYGSVFIADQGNHRIRVMACSACPPRFFCPNTGGSLACSPGSYCPAGSTTPTPCPAGTYSLTVGAESAATCVGPCPSGAYCPSGTSIPVLCPPGTFSTATGATSPSVCTPCTAAPGSACAAGATSAAGSPCPSGSFCTGGANPSRSCVCPGLCTAAGLTTEATAGSAATVWTSSLLVGGGDGYPPSGVVDGPVTVAKFQQPRALAVSPITGQILVGDSMRLRLVFPNGTVAAWAGSGTFGYLDGQGTSATFSSQLLSLAFDTFGNVHIADGNPTRLRRGSLSAYIDTITSSSSMYLGISMDIAGNVYLVGQTDHTVRLVFTNGTSVLLSGTPSVMSPFSDGPRGNATFSSPQGTALSADGATLYVADTNNHRVRIVTTSWGNTSTLAGNGTALTRDGTGLAASFASPVALALTNGGAGGLLFVAESGGGSGMRIRLVNVATGVVSTISGSTEVAGLKYNEGPGGTAAYQSVSSLVVDATGTLLLADASNFRVRRLQCGLCPAGYFCSGTTVRKCPAGRFGTAGASSSACSGPCSAAPGFACSAGATSAAGTLCPQGSYCSGGAEPAVACECPGVCPRGTSVDPGAGGDIAFLWNSSLLAGNGTPSYSNGPGNSATFKMPRAVALEATSGRIIVADSANFRLRGVDTTNPDNPTSLVAGLGLQFTSDGWFPNNYLSNPVGLETADWGVIFMSDATSHVLRTLAPPFNAVGGYVALFAGSNGVAGCTSSLGGAVGASANFNTPVGMAYSTASGTPTLFVTSYSSHVIHAINVATANVTLFAGACGTSGLSDGAGFDSRFNNPYGLAAHPTSGDLYVSDLSNFVLRKVTPQGVVSTVAGLGGTQGGIDGEGLGPARLGGLRHIAVDSSGAVYLTDTFNNRVRRFGSNRQVYAGSNTTIVSLWGGASGYAEGPGTSGRLLTGGALGVALTAGGNIILADAGNNRVRQLNCTICPAGFYCLHNAATGFTLTACPPGYFCPSGTSAISLPLYGCPVGNYCPTGSTAPTPCPPGTYGLGNLKGTLLSGCQGPCMPGYYCPQGTPSMTSFACGVGNYCPANSTAPTPCPTLGSIDPVLGPSNGPAFDVDTAACLGHCYFGAAGQTSTCI